MFAEWLPSPIVINIFGFFAVHILAVYYADKSGLNPVVMFWSGLWGIVGSVLIAFLYVSVLNASNMDSISFVAIARGGGGVMAAFVGALLAGGAYLRWKRVAVLAYVDVAIPAVAIGYIVARLACLRAGDCFGALTDAFWATQFPANTEIYAEHLARGWITSDAVASLPVHPTQIYHALAALMLFLILSFLPRCWPGYQLANALILYGLARFFIQFYRDEYQQGMIVLDVTHYICLLFIGGGFGIWLYMRKQAKG